MARRPGAALTRRDVALALLTKPAVEALAGLPTLRRELVAAGNPFSTALWESAEATLTSIQQGAATRGEVQSWLTSTGTEPVDLIDQMFIWPEEAGPVANEMHALLVAHLESLVADGAIDPDLLVTGDREAVAAHRQHQVEWLDTPLSDGRVPRMAIEDEEAFLAAWDDAEHDAWEILRRLLDEVGERPCPGSELAAAAARLRAALSQDRRGTALIRAAAGVDPESLPDDDAALWLTLASGMIAQRDEQPCREHDVETLSAWSALQHPDWIAAAITLARGGVGTHVAVDRLAALLAGFDYEESDDEMMGNEEMGNEEMGDGDFAGDRDEADSISHGLSPVLQLWRQLGAVDRDDGLTQLGWWGIPESLDRAWQPSSPDGGR